jgi:hypothetical protein
MTLSARARGSAEVPVEHPKIGRYVNPSVRNPLPGAAYPLRIALWFGTRTSECWNKELRTKAGWFPLDPLRYRWRSCRRSLPSPRIPDEPDATPHDDRDSR